MLDIVTGLSLDDLRAITEQATKGPWSWGWGEDANPPLTRTTRYGVAEDAYGVVDQFDHPVATTRRTKDGYEDAQFIAIARNFMPELLATITSLRIQVEEGEREREELAKASHLIDVYDHCDCTYDCICDENGPCVTCALGIRWRFAYSKALDAAGITDDSYIDAAAALAPIEGDK